MAGIDELLRIMARLRHPDRGCPWDLAQDFSSISPHTIEEAYEVDEAIARSDLAALRDELGDLLFQVVFQARLAEERGAFDFAGVVESVCAKLVRRHPHIFADAPAPGSAANQLASWEAIKAAERAAARAPDLARPDPFEGIPRALPALTRSAKLAGRIDGLSARTRGEWAASLGSGEGVVPEVRSPAAVDAALAGVARAATHAVERISGHSAGRAAMSDATGADPEPARAERLALVGEGLRTWAELARQLGIDPEQALRERDDETIAVVRADVHQGGSSRHR